MDAPFSSGSRRKFLKTIALLTGGTAAGWGAADGKTESDALGRVLPRRALGKTGERVTMLGLGGAHAALESGRKAEELIEAAIAGGVRFFDTAVQYQNGGSERFYGQYLTPKYREHIFLMTKTEAKTAAQAGRDLAGSLERMRTDRIDLWQVHAVKSPEDAEARAKGGVFDFFRRARAEGKVRHIGFTGHSRPDGHLRMLELFPEAETVQMPINAIDPAYQSFIERVIPVAAEKGMGILAMKTLSDRGFFGWNRWAQRATGVAPLIPDRISLAEALHFVWSLPVSVLITGAESVEQLQEKIELAGNFHGMTAAQRAKITAKVSDLAGNAVEFYKA